MSNDNLLQAARDVLRHSHSPYSRFRVGAAVLTASGKIYTGCNIENSSFSLSVCAERTALFKAVSEGERSFTRILIVSDAEDYITPCGACRQVISDLAGDIDIVMTNGSGEERKMKLSELLPSAFGNSILKTKR
jgi:cytidine deaminase